MIKIRKMEDGIIIPARIQANSSKERVMGEYAEKLKIAVTSLPEKGKANKAIIKALAKWLNIKTSDIQIVSGEKSKDKEIFVRNITEKDLYRLI
ncbi:MAG: DUF167 domain-containing protein [Candidatus Scalinduaceae bacterium]